MDKNFAQAHQISLRKLHCPAFVVVIAGRPIASGNIVEDSEPVSLALNNLPCVISFNIISSLEHPIVLGLPWFKLHNLNIDWRTREIRYRQSWESTHKIPTIWLHQLREEGHKESMFVFTMKTIRCLESREMWRQSLATMFAHLEHCIGLLHTTIPPGRGILPTGIRQRWLGCHLENGSNQFVFVSDRITDNSLVLL